MGLEADAAIMKSLPVGLVEWEHGPSLNANRLCTGEAASPGCRPLIHATQFAANALKNPGQVAPRPRDK